MNVNIDHVNKTLVATNAALFSYFAYTLWKDPSVDNFLILGVPTFFTGSTVAGFLGKNIIKKHQPSITRAFNKAAKVCWPVARKIMLGYEQARHTGAVSSTYAKNMVGLLVPTIAASSGATFYWALSSSAEGHGSGPKVVGGIICLFASMIFGGVTVLNDEWKTSVRDGYKRSKEEVEQLKQQHLDRSAAIRKSVPFQLAA